MSIGKLDLFNPVLNLSLYLPDSFQVVYNPSDPAGNKFVAADNLNKDAGIRIEFQLPGQPDGMAFQNFFFNANLDVSLANFTGTDYNIGEFAQENPALSPLSVPEPSSIVLCTGPLMMAIVMWVRGRRRAAILDVTDDEQLGSSGNLAELIVSRIVAAQAHRTVIKPRISVFADLRLTHSAASPDRVCVEIPRLSDW